MNSIIGSSGILIFLSFIVTLFAYFFNTELLVYAGALAWGVTSDFIFYN